MKYHMVDIYKACRESANAAWDQLRILHPTIARFNPPKLNFCNRLYRTAGKCYYEENSITIANKFLIYQNSKYLETMLSDTIPHEVCHQVDFNLRGHAIEKDIHGKSWQELMIELGVEPNAYHTMDVPQSFKLRVIK